MQSITSTSNALYKEVKNLKQKKFRDEKDEYLIEGVRFVEEALKSKAEIKTIFFDHKLEKVKGGNELLAMVMKTDITLYEVSEHLLEGLSDTENAQGVVAVLPVRSYALNEVVSSSKRLLVLETIQDPGNMGTIIRTADAADFDGIVALKGCVDIYNPKVLRSTMGSIFHIPVVTNAEMEEAVYLIRENGLKSFAAHLKGEKSIYEANMSEGGVIFIGNEANGLSEELSDNADELVKIPMPGKAESLNASIASALFMYEMVRQGKNSD